MSRIWRVSSNYILLWSDAVRGCLIFFSTSVYKQVALQRSAALSNDLIWSSSNAASSCPTNGRQRYRSIVRQRQKSINHTDRFFSVAACSKAYLLFWCTATVLSTDTYIDLLCPLSGFVDFRTFPDFLHVSLTCFSVETSQLSDLREIGKYFWET